MIGFDTGAAMQRQRILRVGQEAGAADAGCIGKPADAARTEKARRGALQPASSPI